MLRLVPGNRPNLVSEMVSQLSDSFDLAYELLNEESALTADVIIPLCLQDYDVLRECPALGVKALFPSEDAVKICNDKACFREWFQERFSTKYRPGNTGKTTLQIAKKRVTEFGRGSFLFLPTEIRTLEQIKNDSSMFVEDYVEGSTEFSSHVLIDREQILFTALTTYKHDRAQYVRGEHYNKAQTLIEENHDHK